MTRYMRLGIHTLSHFAVDFCCFYVLFAVFKDAGRSAASVTAGFLLYNVIAFGLQVLIGSLRDHHPAFPAARIGCALVLVSLLISRLSGSMIAYAALGLCALGNAFFHVGGGADTLIGSAGRMSDNGVFVSSGSLGVLLGTLAGNSRISLVVPLALIVLCAALQMTAKPLDGSARFDAADETRGFSITIVLLLLAVLLRACVGTVVPTLWKIGSIGACLPAIAAFAGKAAGGFLADSFGARRTGCIALLLSTVLLSFFSDNPALYTAGILLFNVPMSITLCACCDVLPEHPGLSFGLTTLALLLGVLPVYAGLLSSAAAPWAIPTLTIAALLCLMIATRNKCSAWQLRRSTKKHEGE